jgi:3-oxoacyl-[acyl-carrier-protein] synthase-3
MPRVGILGLGVHLPPEVRTNAWWPPELVASWMAARANHPVSSLPPDASEGTRRVAAAMAEQARDPFQGTVERRVLAADASVLDMEEQAARIAIERAGVDPSAIDLLLTNTIVPEFLLGNPACGLHHRLGLSQACFSMHGDVPTYAFMQQLSIAEAMISAGHARCALLVQSCAPSRLLDPTDVIAPFFGDLATAAVVGPVAETHGILASAHYTDGRFPKTLIASVPGRPWYADGRALLHIGDPVATRDVFLQTADAFQSSIDVVLSRAGLARAAVDFLAIHQGTPWLRRVVQEFAGLSSARSIETFIQTAYVFSCTLPASLALAEQDRLLTADNVVVLAGGGPGTTHGAIVLRWGGR